MTKSLQDYDVWATCDDEAVNGNCGLECCVYQRGECTMEDEINEEYGIVVKAKPRDNDFDRAMEILE